MNASPREPILVTGAAGRLGSIGRTVTHSLLDRGFAVRALVRQDDDRAAALRHAGAEVVVADLLDPTAVYRAVSGTRRVYFGMSVSESFLEATTTMAAAARQLGVEVFVNISQMTVSEMNLERTTQSRQQRQHWLAEQTLAWSGLPIVTVRPTMFMESFIPLVSTSVRDTGQIELPFGKGRTNPVAADDVARVVTEALAEPGPHVGRVYELTGPRSQDLNGIAAEFSEALHRNIVYADADPTRWEAELRRQKLPEHLINHVVTMADLHRAGRYDRFTNDVERMTGCPAIGIREFVADHWKFFACSSPGAESPSQRPS